MEGKDVNLNEINKLPESEFRKHFTQWVEEDGVARALQAKLRKDLIETFSRTHLGRRIYAMYSKANRMILSPLILALNTLVAEFLYAQNCHFSLSVFSTEVPYRNTLPDFETVTPFRFSRSEITEIFEAISTNINQDFQNTIIECYLKKPLPKGCMSLLYLIFKNIFKTAKIPAVNSQTETKEPAPESIRSATTAATSKDRTDTETSKQKDDESSEPQPKKQQYNAFYNNQFRYLNKYLIILSRKVKQMSNSLEQLEKREMDSNRVKRKSLQTRKIEHLSRSLEKISENLRVLSLSKRKNRKMSVIISSIDKLAQHLEKCSQNVDIMSRSMREASQPKIDKSTISEKTYSEWIRELTSTKSGKKFIAKVEAALRQTLEEEKEKLLQAFEQKLENHKALIKLKYKQKLLLRLEAQGPSKPQNEKCNEMQTFVEKKLDELNKKHDELLRNIQEKDQQLKETEAALNIQDEKSEDKQTSAKRKLFTDQENDRDQIEYKDQPVDRVQYIDSRPSSKVIDLKLQLEEMARCIADQERNIDAIIYGAKLRVQKLEFESNQLDRSFQEFIEKQHGEESRLDEHTDKVIRSYKNRKSHSKVSNLRKRASRKPKEIIDFGNITRRGPAEEATHFAETTTSIDENPPRIPSPPLETPFEKFKNEFQTYELRELENRLQPIHEVSLSRLRECITVTSPAQGDPKDYNIETKSEHDEKKSMSPVSSDLNLQDASLDGIALSDTKSSDKSYSPDKISMALKAPNVALTRTVSCVEDVNIDTSISLSDKIVISTGDHGSSNENFWD